MITDVIYVNLLSQFLWNLLNKITPSDTKPEANTSISVLQTVNLKEMITKTDSFVDELV